MATRRWGLLVLLGVAATLAAEPALAQCAMCKTVLLNSPEGRLLSRDLDRGILLMFAAPYVVFGSLAAAIFRKPLGHRIALLFARLRGRA